MRPVSVARAIEQRTCRRRDLQRAAAARIERELEALADMLLAVDAVVHASLACVS